MGDVENAIAMALKKEGMELPVPKLHIRSANDNGKKTAEPEHQSKGSRKRKRRRLEKDIARKEELKKVDFDKPVRITEIKKYFSLQKLKLVEDQIDAKPDVDEMDEYEMMCIRGGSPPPVSHSLIPPKNEDVYYSDDSYTSYDSYEDRIQKRRVKDRRGGRNKGGGKRRRDDSEVISF